jgi:hypothetical protein
MSNENNLRVASPEWVISGRGDALVESQLQGGWGSNPAPLSRGASSVDFGHREITVPAGDSPAEIAVRTHELLHARISPVSVPPQLMTQLGVTSSAVRLAEEVRVNVLGSMLEKKTGGEVSVRAMKDGSEKGIADNAVEQDQWQAALSIFLNTYETCEFKTVKRRLRKKEEWREPLSIVEKYLNKRLHAREVSRIIDSTLPTNYKWVDARDGSKGSALLGYGFINVTLSLAQQVDEWLLHPPAPRAKGMPTEGKKRPISDGHGTEWEALRFGMTSLTETTTSFIGKRKRPAMMGKYPSRPDRLLTDPERRIFRETVRGEGGIVVFDCSGSMSVTHEDVRAVTKKFAGATIVAYTQRGEHEANAWILARNQRMVSEHEFADIPLNHGNGVDGPILRWAIRQKKTPKDFIVWVSDGYVTGKGDYSAETLVAECAELSAKHKIIGVEDCEEALALLEEIKRTGARPANRYARRITHYLNEKEKY